MMSHIRKVVFKTEFSELVQFLIDIIEIWPFALNLVEILI